MQLQAGETVDEEYEDRLAVPPRESAAPLSTDPACLEQTSYVIEENGLATADELRQLRTHGQAPLKGPRRWDPLEFLAALRVRDPDARPLEVERIGRSLSQAIGQQLVLIPFASRMSTPSAFYDANPGVLIGCRQLMCPVLYAEESEVIGVASINPVALRLAADHIVSVMGARTGTKPIVSKMLLHHEGWLSLCQKQFGI